MPQRTTPGASGIAGDILTLNDGGFVAHRAAPSEGRVFSLILCRLLASIPANVIITSHATTAKKCFGAISLFCADNTDIIVIAAVMLLHEKFALRDL